MKKRIILSLAIAFVLMCLFAIYVNGASVNEFGTVETSETIDLTNMSTDTEAKVVLFDGTEYHTYPSRYIVTSAKDLSCSFGAINEAFEKSYAIDSVIRLQIPNTVYTLTNIFNNGRNNNLKEIYFPANSNCTKFNWGCLENCTSIEKINIPASLTEFNGQNHFSRCNSLNEITFDEGFSVTYIPVNFVTNCPSLEYIAFPNSITEVRGGAFSSCANLKTIVFGANLQTMLGSMSDSNKNGSTWYLPATFYSSAVTSEPPSNMFHWEGTKTNGVSGNNNGPKNITFVFSGTKAEAEALQARFKNADATVGEGCVGLSRLYDATLCTEAEYEALTGLKVGEATTGYYLVYGYSECKAFYNNDHIEKEPTYDFEGQKYISNLCSYTACERCVNVIKEKVADSMFTSRGYSKNEAEGSFMYDIAVNYEAMAIYTEKTGATLNYGLAVSGNSKLSTLINEDETIISNDVLKIKLDEARYTNLQLKIANVGTKTDVKIHACAYVIETNEEDDKTVSYIGNGVTTSTSYAISYDEITSSEE